MCLLLRPALGVAKRAQYRADQMTLSMGKVGNETPGANKNPTFVVFANWKNLPFQLNLSLSLSLSQVV